MTNIWLNMKKCDRDFEGLVEQEDNNNALDDILVVEKSVK